MARLPALPRQATAGLACFAASGSVKDPGRSKRARWTAFPPVRRWGTRGSDLIGWCLLFW
jgi:hypothetical protein